MGYVYISHKTLYGNMADSRLRIEKWISGEQRMRCSPEIFCQKNPVKSREKTTQDTCKKGKFMVSYKKDRSSKKDGTWYESKPKRNSNATAPYACAKAYSDAFACTAIKRGNLRSHGILDITFHDRSFACVHAHHHDRSFVYGNRAKKRCYTFGW